MTRPVQNQNILLPPAELFEQAALLGLQLSSDETRALSGLLAEALPNDIAEENLRGDIVLSPYRTYEDLTDPVAQRELALNGLWKSVKNLRNSLKVS